MIRNSYKNFYGIDVSKNWVDVALESKIYRVKQTKASIAKFIKKHVKKSSDSLCVLESTGGYERMVCECLMQENIAVHVAHPSKISSFAKLRGKLAKTDAIDAALLREYGALISQDEIRPPLSRKQQDMQDLSARLAQLKITKHQEKCRSKMAIVTETKKSIKNMLSLINKEIIAIEKTLLSIIKSDEQYKQKYQLLHSMKGVGKALATVMITDMPELGTLNRKQIAALVGVAPLTKQSGKREGIASARYGRVSVRKILYMAALVASKYNKKLKVFYDNLVERGKLKKVALVAVMRKMLVILNAMAHNNKEYQELNA